MCVARKRKETLLRIVSLFICGLLILDPQIGVNDIVFAAAREKGAGNVPFQLIPYHSLLTAMLDPASVKSSMSTRHERSRPFHHINPKSRDLSRPISGSGSKFMETYHRPQQYRLNRYQSRKKIKRPGRHIRPYKHRKRPQPYFVPGGIRIDAHM